MGFIVQFNDGNDTGVFVTHHKVSAHAVNPVVPLVEIVALFDAKKSRKLHLGKDYVIRQCVAKAKVQNMFGLCEWLFGIKRPNCIGLAAMALGIHYNNGGNNTSNKHQKK